MPAPTILIVDDEPQVLNAVERDLRQHFRRDYRIVKAGGGQEALDATRQLKQRGAAVALFLADQRMPNLEGTEFLAEAAKLYPDARKVLLTAYADTEAAITSINEIDLDYYLMKPWDPPEELMYPVLDDLLIDWQANVRLPYDGIRVAGAQWSARCHEVKDFLARNRIPYQWLDIEVDGEARALVDSIENDNHQLPVIFFPDGRVLINPENINLAEACGLQTQANAQTYDLIIIGAGPAGLGAGVYGASEGLRTLMIDMEATGGQAGTSSRIENYLGFPSGISGADLASRATTQARRLGAEILTAQRVADIRVEDPYRIVILADGTELTCRAIILATGVTVRRLDAQGIDRLTGAGIYYGAALTEAANYRDQDVYVVGGANSAGQGAMFFSRYARKVTMLIRGESLAASMSQYLIDQIEATPNIEVRVHTTVEAAHGDERLDAITVKNHNTDEVQTLPAAALFLFIGAVPHTDMVKELIACDAAGFVLTGPQLRRGGRGRAKATAQILDMLADGATENKPSHRWLLDRDPYLLETSIPGVFAAGDVREGAVRRVATAVGEGAVAVSFVHQYLKTV
jgi:thioredoxin reductase (NADPH)